MDKCTSKCKFSVFPLPLQTPPPPSPLIPCSEPWEPTRVNCIENFIKGFHSLWSWLGLASGSPSGSLSGVVGLLCTLKVTAYGWPCSCSLCLKFQKCTLHQPSKIAPHVRAQRLPRTYWPFCPHFSKEPLDQILFR